MPVAAANARSDGLWRHTCFEAFIRASSDIGYYELNFSPSGQWAAYQFSGYRNGMRVADEITGVPIEVRSSPDGCVLRASLDPDRFAGLPRRARVAYRPVGSDRGYERRHILLGARASARQAGLPSCRWLCLRALSGGEAMKFGMDRLISERDPARAAVRQARRVACPSRIRHGKPDAFARCARRLRRHKDQRCLRPATWAARRQAGQHDRVAGFQGSGARHSGLQSLWRGAQADGCNDGRIRCDPRRPAGSRLPHLHLHHDPALRSRGGRETPQVGVGAGPAQPRWPARRRPDACATAGKVSSAPDRCRCGMV